MYRQTAELPRDPGHDVARVTDDYDDGVWAALDHFWDELLEHFDVLLYQVETRLSFLLRRFGGDDDHS